MADLAKTGNDHQLFEPEKMAVYEMKPTAGIPFLEMYTNLYLLHMVLQMEESCMVCKETVMTAQRTKHHGTANIVPAKVVA